MRNFKVQGEVVVLEERSRDVGSYGAITFAPIGYYFVPMANGGIAASAAWIPLSNMDIIRLEIKCHDFGWSGFDIYDGPVQIVLLDNGDTLLTIEMTSGEYYAVEDVDIPVTPDSHIGMNVIAPTDLVNCTFFLATLWFNGPAGGGLPLYLTPGG